MSYHVRLFPRLTLSLIKIAAKVFTPNFSFPEVANQRIFIGKQIPIKLFVIFFGRLSTPHAILASSNCINSGIPSLAVIGRYAQGHVFFLDHFSQLLYAPLE